MAEPQNQAAAASAWAGKLYTAGLFIFVFCCNFSISASQIGLGLALIGCIGQYRAGQMRLKSTPLDLPFAFLALTGILSVFRAEDLSRAVPEIRSYLVIACFYLSFWYEMSEDQLKRLLVVYVTSAALVGMVNGLRTPYLTLIGNRARGFFSTSMTFAECQSMALLVICVIFASVKRDLIRQSLLLFAAAVTSYSLILSKVRSAWLGFFFGILVLFFHFPKRIAIAMLFVLAAVSPVAIADPDVYDRLISFLPSKTAEIAQAKIDDHFTSSSLQGTYHRLTIWLRGMQMLENHFAFGVGLSNTKPWFKHFASKFESENNLIWGHQHNNFVQILASTGLIGLIAFINFIIVTLAFTWQASMSGQNSWRGMVSKGAMAVFLCFLASGIGEYSWGDEEVVMMALFLLGLLMNHHVASEEETGNKNLQPKNAASDTGIPATAVTRL
ncbi:MAG TPA: O-antigen ligase family protein [Candidatus Rifleibacterium sp.]|nr:O-antigen ligase family protein [Candidatus Rifleibacterium sp.]HPT46847.1 O-antigen ligase family protein [Candidatus Rifleibacterium sp.]